MMGDVDPHFSPPRILTSDRDGGQDRLLALPGSGAGAAGTILI